MEVGTGSRGANCGCMMGYHGIFVARTDKTLMKLTALPGRAGLPSRLALLRSAQLHEITRGETFDAEGGLVHGFAPGIEEQEALIFAEALQQPLRARIDAATACDLKMVALAWCKVTRCLCWSTPFRCRHRACHSNQSARCNQQTLQNSSDHYGSSPIILTRQQKRKHQLL